MTAFFLQKCIASEQPLRGLFSKYVFAKNVPPPFKKIDSDMRSARYAACKTWAYKRRRRRKNQTPPKIVREKSRFAQQDSNGHGDDEEGGRRGLQRPSGVGSDFCSTSYLAPLEFWQSLFMAYFHPVDFIGQRIQNGHLTRILPFLVYSHFWLDSFAFA